MLVMEVAHAIISATFGYEVIDINRQAAEYSLE